MDLVFNELSTKFGLPNSQTEAITCLNELCKTLIHYRKTCKYPNALIQSNEPFSKFSLVSDFSASWKEVFMKLDVDKQNIISQAITSKPLIRDVPPYYFYQIENNQEEVMGFAYAYEKGLKSVSYNNSIWNESCYTIQKITDDSEEYVQVEHFWLDTSISQKDAFYTSLKSSEELWNRREDIFPKLSFCGDTKKQICALSTSNKYLRTAYDKLKILNDGLYNIVSINEFDYNSLGITISPESDSTLNQFAGERTFQIPNTNRSEIFTLHIKNGDWRIHFYLDKETDKCYIGYIGKHLRT